MTGLPWPADNMWLDAAADSLPGKRRHVWSLVGVLNHLEGFGRQQLAPICSPLLSQPVVETCLRIPSWLWFAQGRNRSVARAAFAGLLPATVTGRRTKAAFDSLGARIIRLNARRLRSMLLDGVLVKEGIADPDGIDRAFRGDIADGEVVAELLGIADVEAWASGWVFWSPGQFRLIA
jgi:asparagine synthase (glutamine-hydrolysing)